MKRKRREKSQHRTRNERREREKTKKSTYDRKYEMFCYVILVHRIQTVCNYALHSVLVVVVIIVAIVMLDVGCMIASVSSQTQCYIKLLAYEI